QDGAYVFKKSGGEKKTADEMIALYKSWIDSYPIVSIEDGLAEDDWAGWAKLTEALASRVQLVGDDRFCTNVERLGRVIEEGCARLEWLQRGGRLARERQAVRGLAAEPGSRARGARALASDPVAQERAAREESGMIRDGQVLYRLVPRVPPSPSP